MDQLIQKLATAGLIDDMGNIILEIYENGERQSVDQQTFGIFFGDVAANPTYTALSGSHTFLWGDPAVSTKATAAQLGYQKYFDQWKAKGIIQ